MSTELAPALEAGLEGLSSVTVNGVALAYRERGEGDPVILVHGSAGDLRTWERQLPALAQSHRAIVYSRRYARPNEDIPADVDDQMVPHVDDLVGLIEAQDAAPAHLVGHSWGGFICLLAAIRHPELVRSLVLEEPPVLPLFVSNPPRPAELLSLLIRRPRAALAIVGFGAGTFARARRAFQHGNDEEGMRRFASGVLGPGAYERVPEERRAQMRENLGALRAQVTGEGFPALTEDQVRDVAVPTLLLRGECSSAALRHMSERLFALLPDVEQVEIPGASHRMHEENPAAVNEAILAFLDRP